MRIVQQFFGLLCLVSVLAGCNTVQGAGQDMSSAGHAVSSAAESAK
ncbi:MAG: entericidin A/B family lipoprotein [Gammaproteobacteria bacterium]|nr:entericidin A/B family lipoprotein [Gammaproteobacteria bacterium]